MKSINDVSKVADCIKSNFKGSQVKVQLVVDGSLDVIAPYLPPDVVSLVSSDIRIGVFPYGSGEVLINIYKI